MPGVLADVVRYEEILAAFEERGSLHIQELQVLALLALLVQKYKY
jgi:hypothetical protein